MVSDFGVLLLFLIAGLFLSGGIIAFGRLLRPQRPDPSKLSVYECGEESVSSAWGSFNLRFFVTALIFVLFEVELVFLFPWAKVFGIKNFHEQSDGLWAGVTLFEVFIFVFLLLLGLAFAWRKGALSWIRPSAVIPKENSKIPVEAYKEFIEK